MTCETCGEKPKKCGNCNKDFPRAVIEINNPETLVLLRKVVIPASMGTEEQVPAAIGKYHNVILKYEANNHVYLYSSDGIPTLLEMDVPQEIIDRIDDLEQEITLAKGAPRLLTTDDQNWNTGTQSTAEPHNCIALWLLPPGTYQKDSNTGLVRYSRSNNVSEEDVFIVGKKSTHGTPMLRLRAVKSTDGQPGHYFYTTLTSVFVDTAGNSISDSVWDIIKPADDLTTTAMNVPLAAKQGKILNERIGDLSTLTTTAKTSAVAAINELDSRIIGSLASAPTTSTAGSVGSLLATVESGTGHLYICTDDTGGTYTWQTLV